MDNKLRIQWFIEQNPDWERILREKPYCLNITRDRMFGRNLIMFKYNQIESDFMNPLVRECRGLILDEDTLEKVSIPFFKFGNAGEPYCPEIDWNHSWVGSKIDGSLIKVVRLGDRLLISTNGTIDAFKATLAEQLGCRAKSFGELFVEALKTDNLMTDTFLGLLEEGKTYMFELTSPYNRVVVSWPETRLYFLGVRDNETLQETYFLEDCLSRMFKTPEVFFLGSLDECIKAASALDCNEEGYVVCDRNFNRVKVKSPLYVSLHHMANNHVMTHERGLEIVRKNELDEVVIYFPEFKEELEKIKMDYHNLIETIKESQRRFLEESSGCETRKDFAMLIKKEFGKFSGVGFALLDKKVSTVEEWVEKATTLNLCKYLGYKD
jgi:hypothetical protein